MVIHVQKKYVWFKSYLCCLFWLCINHHMGSTILITRVPEHVIPDLPLNISGGWLLVKPLLEWVKGVDSALVLGAGGSPLKLEFSGVHHRPQDGQGPGPDVLTSVLQSSEYRRLELDRILARGPGSPDQVGQIAEHWALVHDGSRHSLRDLHLVVVFVEISEKGREVLNKEQ